MYKKVAYDFLAGLFHLFVKKLWSLNLSLSVTPGLTLTPSL